MKWEYIVFKAGSYEDVADELNDSGASGWYLAWVVIEDGVYTVFLQRQIEKEAGQ